MLWHLGSGDGEGRGTDTWGQTRPRLMAAAALPLAFAFALPCLLPARQFFPQTFSFSQHCLPLPPTTYPPPAYATFFPPTHVYRDMLTAAHRQQLAWTSSPGLLAGETDGPASEAQQPALPAHQLAHMQLSPPSSPRQASDSSSVSQAFQTGGALWTGDLEGDLQA